MGHALQHKLSETFQQALHRTLKKGDSQHKHSVDALYKGASSNAATNIQQLCVAYSGGLDSTVLLHVAYQYCMLNPHVSLSAFHVNHGINKGANDWQRHCQQQCDKLKIPMFSKQLRLSKKPQQSLEADARDARYLALDEYASTQKIVLLGQHQDDQAETFLLQLKRGGGVQGLASMSQSFQRMAKNAQVSNQKNTYNHSVCYIRPLLDCTRAELHAYAQHHHLSWIEDESNQDQIYERNFLRSSILPVFQQRWPHFSKMVARSAANCADAANANAEYMALLSESLLVEPNQQVFMQNNWPSLKLEAFRHCSLSVQRTFLRYWLLTSSGLTPSMRQLDQIMELAHEKSFSSVKKATEGATKQSVNPSPHLQFGKIVIERYLQYLQIMQVESAHVLQHKPQSIKLDFSQSSTFMLNDRLMLSRAEDTAQSPKLPFHSQVFRLPKTAFLCEFGASHLVFKHQHNRPTKKLKVWYQEWAVSPLQRQFVPVFSQHNSALVVGLKYPKLCAVPIADSVLARLTFSEN